ncbi:unnamed protein product [Rotaria sp. Silwood2]|nr:unnamed protein product [Rotaria sp. Silwood2]
MLRDAVKHFIQRWDIHKVIWFVIKDSYIIDIRPDIHEVCFRMLVDCDFQVSTGIPNIGDDDAHNGNEWMKHLSNLTEQLKDFVNETRNRFDSYAPIRKKSISILVKFINGKSYMSPNAKAFLTAKEEVFIIDWWLSPELILIRPADENTFRLDNILGRITNARARVHVMLYKKMPFALALNSLYTKIKLVSKREKDDENSNDEKILKEQQSDTTSTSETDRKHRYFIGKDYSNIYQKDITEVQDYKTDSVIRTLVPRMLWHDEALAVFGQTTRDVARYFIQR